MSFIIIYLSTLFPMLILDVIWLGTMSKRFYSIHLASLMTKTPNLLPAGIFYLLYALGLSVLIISPALKNNTPFLKIFLVGALMGLVAYGTYDLTNQATLKDWPFIVTLVDLLWGTFFSGVVSVTAVFILKRLY